MPLKHCTQTMNPQWGAGHLISHHLPSRYAKDASNHYKFP